MSDEWPGYYYAIRDANMTWERSCAGEMVCTLTVSFESNDLNGMCDMWNRIQKAASGEGWANNAGDPFAGTRRKVEDDKVSTAGRKLLDVMGQFPNPS